MTDLLLGAALGAMVMWAVLRIFVIRDLEDEYQRGFRNASDAAFKRGFATGVSINHPYQQGYEAGYAARSPVPDENTVSTQSQVWHLGQTVKPKEQA